MKNSFFYNKTKRLVFMDLGLLKVIWKMDRHAKLSQSRTKRILIGSDRE